jgi:hypothetical protein
LKNKTKSVDEKSWTIEKEYCEMISVKLNFGKMNFPQNEISEK